MARTWHHITFPHLEHRISNPYVGGERAKFSETVKDSFVGNWYFEHPCKCPYHLSAVNKDTRIRAAINEGIKEWNATGHSDFDDECLGQTDKRCA